MANSGPATTTNQSSGGGASGVANNVNRFQGNLTFPLSVLSLPGRTGLDVALTAMYRSGVQGAVALDNAAAPTGILGLGWSLPFDQVTLSGDGSCSLHGNTYAVTAGGSGGSLIATGEVQAGPDGQAVYGFALAQYQFWRVAYVSSDERWEVVTPDGVTYVYGGAARGGVQWGLAHGNWLGASAASGATRYALAWNLVEMRNRWGDAVAFHYDNDEVALDGGRPGDGPTYTRASYLHRIVDSTGRILTFTYGDKTFDLDAGVYEYLPPHLDAQGRPQPAYQDRYETRYLRAIEVAQPRATACVPAATADDDTAPVPVYTVHFGYEVTAAGSTASDGRGALIKRYLTAMSRISGAGVGGPVVAFSYEHEASTEDDPRPTGSLTGVTYPTGATAQYDYQRLALEEARTVQAVDVSGTPGVWFGSDFAVVTELGNGTLAISAYTWTGTWQPWARAGAISAAVADDTLAVVAGDDWFALSYTDTAASASDHVFLYRRDPGQLGTWIEEHHVLPRGDGTTPTVIAAGAAFVAYACSAYSGGDTSTPVVAYHCGSDGGWVEDAIGMAGTGPIALTGQGAYVALARYDADAETMAYELYYYDQFRRALVRGSQWSTALSILTNPDATDDDSLWNLVFFSPGATFVACTYLTAIDTKANTQTYAVRIYDWTSDFVVTEDTGAYLKSVTVDLDLDLPALITVATGSQVGNCNLSVRYDGERWRAQTVPLDVSGSGEIAFAYGSDLMLATRTSGAPSALRFDPPTDAWVSTAIASPSTSGAGPAPARISGRLATIGRSVYQQGTDAGWHHLGDLPGTTSTDSVRVCGEGLITFEEGTGTAASARIALVANGRLIVPGGADQAPLDGQRFMVDDASGRGTSLIGPGMFATYPAASGFTSTRALTLHKLVDQRVDQPLAAFAVVGVAVDDGVQIAQTRWWYDTSTASYSAAGRTPQYSTVWSFAGEGTTPSDAASGATEYRYYNGLAPDQRGIFYPDAATRANYSRLNGATLFQRGYERTDGGELAFRTFAMNCTAVMDGPAGTVWSRVGRTLSAGDVAVAFAVPADDTTLATLDAGQLPAEVAAGFADNGFALTSAVTIMNELANERWMAVDDGAGACYFLWLSADRTTIEVHAGTSQIKAYVHDPGNGLVRQSTTWNQRRDGTVEVHTRALRYGGTAPSSSEAPTYPGMQAAHFLTGLVEITTAVDGVTTSTRAITWRDDWNGKPGQWGPAGVYRARTAAVPFSWTDAPDPAVWKLSRDIVGRDRHGQVIERRTGAGQVRSTWFDVAGVNALVAFTGASRARGECVYLGFQPYEDASAWTLGGAPSLAPALVSGDAHTGVQALALAPGQTATTGLVSTWTMTPTHTAYALSFWVKTPAALDGDDRDAAAFTVTAAQGGVTLATVRVAIEDTREAWLHRTGVLQLDASVIGTPVTLTLAAVNGTVATTILVDDIAFLPAQGQANAQTYDAISRQSTAQVTSTGLTQYVVFDPLGKVASGSAHGRVPAGASVIGSARRAGGGRLDPSSPNFVVAMQAGDGGVFETFGDGDAWQRRWSQGTSQGWATQDGALVHGGGVADGLSLVQAEPPQRTAIAIQARIEPRGFLTAPIELAVGTSIAIRWTPGVGTSDPGTWALIDPTTGAARSAVVTPGPLFTLPLRCAPLVASAASAAAVPPLLAELLAAQGLALSPTGATVVALDRDRWRVDDPERFQRYLISTGPDGLAVSRLTLAPSVWALVATPGAAIFYAGGLAVVSALVDVDVDAAPAVIATDAVALGFLTVLFDPTVAVQYLTANGLALQQQALDGATLYVQATVCDPLGRPIADTKTAALPATLPGYRTGFVTAPDPTTGTVGGEIAAYYAGQDGRSDDQGYPFRSFVYERAPTGRILEQGAPGRDFAIDPSNPARHTTRYCYGGDARAYGLVGGAFQVVTRTDPNGARTVQLTDRLGDVVQGLAATDAAGTSWRSSTRDRTASSSGSRTTERVPNAAAPPPPSQPDDWTLTQDVDLLGHTIATSRPGHGTRTYLYDGAGRIRFQQDEVGRTAATPYVQYVKYDGLGRVVEAGATAGSWDQVAAHVDDPRWPDEPATWHRRNTYGTDATQPCALGRLIQVQTNHGDQGTADVVETYAYDLSGDLVAATQCLPGVDATVYTTRYRRDALGRTREVVYPDGDEASGRAPTTVRYQFDGRGRIVAVGRSRAEPATFARYTYDADGAIAGETLLPDSAGALARTWTVNPPGWPTAVTDALTADTASYTSGGVDGAAFYDGALAATSAALRWDGAPAARADQFDHAASGWLTQADGAGTSDDFGYDANGNLTAIGAASCTYQTGTDRLLRLPGSTADDFGYDANGNVTMARPHDLAAITYDPVTQLPRTVTIARPGGSGGTASYLYGAQRRRLWKSVDDPDGAGVFTKRYVRGSNGLALLERTVDAAGAIRTQALIYGPRGLAAVLDGGETRSVLLDRLGSVVAVADATGAPIAGFQYGPLGAVTTWGEPTAIAYRFTGQEFDPETGLYNYNLRLYDPVIGRFYAPDPAAQFPSLYLYAANDPLRYVDPSGAMSAKNWFLLGFIVVAAAFSIFLVVISFGTDAVEVGAVDELLVDELVAGTGDAALGLVAEDEEIEVNAKLIEGSIKADVGSTPSDSEYLSFSESEGDEGYVTAPDEGDDSFHSCFGDEDAAAPAQGKGWWEWGTDLASNFWSSYAEASVNTEQELHGAWSGAVSAAGTTISNSLTAAMEAPAELTRRAMTQAWEWGSWAGTQAIEGGKWVVGQMTFATKALGVGVAVSIVVTPAVAVVAVINMF